MFQPSPNRRWPLIKQGDAPRPAENTRAGNYFLSPRSSKADFIVHRIRIGFNSAQRSTFTTRASLDNAPNSISQFDETMRRFFFPRVAIFCRLIQPSSATKGRRGKAEWRSKVIVVDFLLYVVARTQQHQHLLWISINSQGRPFKKESPKKKRRKSL